MKIFLVEDDPLLGDLFSTSIKNSGYELTHVSSGEEALRIVSMVLPDIILLDLVLPGISGFEVLENIKANTATANIPVIIISNLSDKQNIEKANALGAIFYFIKSNVLPRDIIEKVKTVLDEKKVI